MHACGKEKEKLGKKMVKCIECKPLKLNTNFENVVLGIGN